MSFYQKRNMKKCKIEGNLDNTTSKKIIEDYQQDSKNSLVRHAISRNAVGSVVFEPNAVSAVAPHFSVEIKTLPVTDQKRSGHCWIFAGLNILRETIAKKCNIKNFELSQNYIALYDKIEKSNFALETCIQLCNCSPNERVFQFILNNPVSDGGQWDMFINLVKKYGVIPKEIFPETYQSSNTRETVFLVNAAIRSFASNACRLAKEGKNEEIRPLKDKVMKKIYMMFLNAFSVPPRTFDFEYTDEKDEFHIDANLTPIQFCEKYLGDEIYQYQSIINSPTEDKPFGKTFTIDYLGNVLEGKPIHHLNIKMNRIKELIIKQLSNGDVVWFGSDVSFYLLRDYFAWDDNSFDYKSAFDIDIEFEKGAMLDFRHSAMNHAMIITGVDLKNGKPTKWKIENSWGDEVGEKGYYVMSDSWFNKFVYQAVILKKNLSQKELAASKQEPIHLYPWDPMGALAD